MNQVGTLAIWNPKCMGILFFLGSKAREDSLGSTLDSKKMGANYVPLEKVTKWVKLDSLFK